MTDEPRLLRQVFPGAQTQEADLRASRIGQKKETFMSFFTNGNARIGRLIILQLAVGAVKMVLTSLLASLPAQAWLTPKALNIVCFFVGTILIVVTATEMFLSKTSSFLKDHKEPDPIPSGNTEQFVKPPTS